MNVFYYFIFVLLINLNSVSASNNIQIFEDYKNKFLEYYNSNDYDKALEASYDYIKYAEEIYPGLDNQKATAYYNVAALLIDLSLYEDAKEKLFKSLDISKAINDYYLLDIEKAKTLTKYQQEELLLFFAKITNSLGLVHEKTSEFKTSLYYYDWSYETLLLLDQNMDEKDRDQLDYNFFAYYNNTGNLLSLMGDYETASYRLNEALYIFEKMFDYEHYYLISPLNSIALNFLRQKKPIEAETVLLRANNIINKGISDYPDSLDTFNYHLAKNYKNLSGAYHLMVEELIFINCKEAKGRSAQYNNCANTKEINEKIDVAIQYALEALDIERELYGWGVSLTNTFTNLANLYTYAKDPNQALMYADLAIGEYQTFYKTENHMDVASAYANKANIYFAVPSKFDLDQAEYYFKKALDISKNVLPPDHNNLITMYANVASVKKAQGDIKSHIDYLELANNIFYQRLARNNYFVEEQISNEMDFAYPYVTDYINAITGYIRINETKISNDELVGFVDKAFRAHQMAKESKAARALALSSSRFSVSNQDIQKIIKNYQDSENERSKLEKELSDILILPNEQRNLNRIENIRDKLISIKTKNIEYTDKLEKEFPEFAISNSIKSISLASAVSQIKNNQIMVSYHIGEDKLTTFVISKGSFYLFESEISRTDLMLLIKELRSYTKPSNIYKVYDFELSNKLFEILFPFPKNLWTDIEELILVPTGPLMSLPFATLITDQSNFTFRKANWLIKQVSISYLPSIKSLEYSKDNDDKLFNKNFIGIGDPILINYQNQNELNSFDQLMEINQFSPLPETREELSIIAKSLNQPLENLYMGEKAREEVVKKIDFSNTNIIMFATHGILSGELANVYEPALILTPPNEITNEDDGLLTASDIMKMDLNADWVILSACNTAAGDNTDAEALSGLAKAFFYAGAKSLLVSQWVVESESTVLLTTGIFENLMNKTNISNAKAFQSSMLKLIDNPEYSHPFYWAPFILVGQN